MRRQLGETRSAIREKFALVCPDSHEITPLPNWPGAEIVCAIAPDMGAQFLQFFAAMPKGAVASRPVAGAERFLFVLEGYISLHAEGTVHKLAPEGYALVPAGMDHEITAGSGCRLIVLEKIYVPLSGQSPPELIISTVAEQPKRAMTDDGMLEVQKLIPTRPEFDCEVNVMDFKPGGSLPYVETHFVEHGLLMLGGGGVYRLQDEWFSVEQGDVIWMGPYCAQWFGAIGNKNARYLIYKNWNRDPLAG